MGRASPPSPARHPFAILYVTLQPRRDGEAGHTHVTEIIRELRALGHTVTLLEPRYRSVAPGIARRLWTIFGVIRQARRELRAGRTDIVYIRWHPFSYWVTARAHQQHLPIVLERNAPLTELFLIRSWLRPLHSVFEWLVRREIRKTNVVVSVTPEILQEARSLAAPMALQGRVISNGANVNVMRYLPGASLAAYGLERGRYVAFIGAMARWQGIPHLLAAVQSPQWPEGIQLVFCGRGPLLGDVLRMTTGGLVKYLGIVPYEEVAVVLSGALAGIAPVDQPPERAAGSSALKVFEYLSCGRPAIVTDVAGLREIIREGDCGRVVPLGAPDAIAEAVRWLYEHPAEREAMGKRARALIVERHSWAVRARDLEQVLIAARNGKALHA